MVDILSLLYLKRTQSQSDVSGSRKLASLSKSVSADLKAINEDPDYANIRSQVKGAAFKGKKKKAPLIPQKSSAQANFKEDTSIDWKATRVPLSASANQLFDASFNLDPFSATPSA